MRSFPRENFYFFGWFRKINKKLREIIILDIFFILKYSFHYKRDMKNIFFKLFSFFALVLIFGFVYKNKLFKSFFVSAQQQTLVVCPSGTAGQNGCNYIGGDGIQQAVDAAPLGSSSNKTKILIKAGSYSRQNFNEYYEYYLNNNRKRKCFVDTKEKFLVFEGEEGVVLDGAASANMSGFCAKGGEIEIKNLKIVGFKKDDDSCFQNDSANPCSRGRGIQLEGNIKALLKNNQITGNQLDGISLYNSSQATIQNNQIIGNQFSGIYLINSSQAIIINNSFYNNSGAGIDIYQCIDHNPSVMAVNNIITNTKKNTDGTFGFGIGGDCLHNAGKLNNDTFAYNLIWGNEGDNTKCGAEELCENFTGRINQDPKFVNPQAYDLHLLPSSPAIGAGDPSIKNPDGSRSDMGAYGGGSGSPLSLVLNGGFEDGGNGWSFEAPNGPIEKQTVEGPGYQSPMALHIKNLDQNKHSRVIQWIPIINGRIYKLSLMVKKVNTDNNEPIVAGNEWCIGDSGNRFIQGQKLTLSSPNEGWQEKSWFFTAGNCDAIQKHSLAVYFDTGIDQNNSGMGEIWVDDVTLTEAKTAPTPTPVNIPDCSCDASGVCGSVCPVNNSSNYWSGAGNNGVSYTKPMRCILSNSTFYSTSPDSTQKNDICRRVNRPKGDVNGDEIPTS